MPKVSVISPVYNASEILETLVDKILINIKKINKNYEIILIDDCSKDDSWKKLNIIKSKLNNIKIKRNRRNIGQHPTIKEALKIAKGDLIFILDCDLQDNPKYFKKLFKLKTNSKTAVFGKINNQKKKGFLSNFFWHIFNLLTGIKNLHEITTFSLIDKIHLKELITMNNNAFIYAEIKKKFPIKYLLYNRKKRYRGKSSYSYFKLLRLACNWLKFYSKLK
jgi:glycosyltransferase involved in cell wall biosynthesis